MQIWICSLSLAFVLTTACSSEKREAENTGLDQASLDSMRAKLAQIDSMVKEESAEEKGYCEKNFAVALNGEKPADVTILNCHYWRSAHFTLEHKYYFEIEKNQKFFEDLIFYGDSLKKVKVDYLSHPEEAPWFTPGKEKDYEEYISKHEHDDFQVYRHKKNGRIYIHGSQL